MNDDILNEVIKFVEKQNGENDFPLTRNTRIEKDLNIWGDDAVCFIIKFGKKFNVDVSNFMAADYFDGEGIDFLGAIFRMVTGKKEKEKKILTLGHLEKSVIAGKLNEEVIND